MTYSRRVRGRVWVPLVVAVAVQLAGVVAVFAWVAGDDLHEAPLGVVAPAVVGQTLADRAAADPDRRHPSGRYCHYPRHAGLCTRQERLIFRISASRKPL